MGNRSQNQGSEDGLMEMSSLIYACQTQGSGVVTCHRRRKMNFENLAMMSTSILFFFDHESLLGIVYVHMHMKGKSRVSRLTAR